MPDFGIFRGFNDKLFGDKLYAGQLPTQLGIIGSQEVTNLTPFQFTVNTAIAGTSGVGKFQLPLVSSLPLNAVVEWGDGSIDTITTFNQAETLHTYASAVTYTIKISGDLSGWRFAGVGDRLKMLNVFNWGDLIISVSSGFFGCTNLTCSATDAPTITSTSLDNYFRNCTNFNGAIGNWNVSNVTDMRAMFIDATVFNQNIGSWNTQNVTLMNQMFIRATNFNQDIGAWNVSNVTNMSNVFQEATNFNANIGSWNVGNVTNMSQMFLFATNFNQDIGAWNVSNVTNMTGMFERATNFNQDIGAWNISNVTNFQDFMFFKTNLNYSAANLDSIYNGWSALPSVKPNLSISFGTIKYTIAGQVGKNILDFAPNNWTIVDGGI